MIYIFLIEYIFIIADVWCAFELLQCSFILAARSCGCHRVISHFSLSASLPPVIRHLYATTLVLPCRDRAKLFHSEAKAREKDMLSSLWRFWRHRPAGSVFWTPGKRRNMMDREEVMGVQGLYTSTWGRAFSSRGLHWVIGYLSFLIQLPLCDRRLESWCFHGGFKACFSTVAGKVRKRREGRHGT